MGLEIVDSAIQFIGVSRVVFPAKRQEIAQSGRGQSVLEARKPQKRHVVLVFSGLRAERRPNCE